METNNNTYVMGRFSDKQDAVLELDRASYVDDVVLDTDESRARVAEASKDWPLVEERFNSPTPEKFFAEGTTPLAETTPAYLTSEQVKEERERFINEVIDPIVEQAAIELGAAAGDSEPTKYKPINVERFSGGLYNQREVVKVDGDRTQLTEAQMSGVVGEVLDQTLIESPSVIDQLIVNSKLSAVYHRIEALEEQNKKIIAALKHLGLDTNKHFR